MTKIFLYEFPQRLNEEFFPKLKDKINSIITQNSDVELWFYQSNQFTKQCLQTILKLKNKYPEKNIKIVRVCESNDIISWGIIPLCIIDKVVYVPQDQISKSPAHRLNKITRWIFRQCDYLLLHTTEENSMTAYARKQPNLKVIELENKNYAVSPPVCRLANLQHANTVKLIAFESVLTYMYKVFDVCEFWIENDTCGSAYGINLARFAEKYNHVSVKFILHEDDDCPPMFEDIILDSDSAVTEIPEFLITDRSLRKKTPRLAKDTAVFDLSNNPVY